MESADGGPGAHAEDLDVWGFSLETRPLLLQAFGEWTSGWKSPSFLPMFFFHCYFCLSSK